jgi:amino-acid N-acetyltransferase
MAPVFRPGAREDRAAVEALLSEQALPSAGVAEMFAADPTQFVLALDGDALIAVAGLEQCGEHALLRSVAVRRDWQRRGLGHALVSRAVAHAEGRGITALYLLTMTAEHYFPRFGFSRIARDEVPADIAGTVEFTSACPASAVTMRKVLSAPGSAAA